MLNALHQRLLGNLRYRLIVVEKDGRFIKWVSGVGVHRDGCFPKSRPLRQVNAEAEQVGDANRDASCGGCPGGRGGLPRSPGVLAVPS